MALDLAVSFYVSRAAASEALGCLFLRVTLPCVAPCGEFLAPVLVLASSHKSLVPESRSFALISCLAALTFVSLLLFGIIHHILNFRFGQCAGWSRLPVADQYVISRSSLLRA